MMVFAGTLSTQLRSKDIVIIGKQSIASGFAVDAGHRCP